MAQKHAFSVIVLLQRELKEMVNNGVLVQEGATNRLLYRLKV